MAPYILHKNEAQEWEYAFVSQAQAFDISLCVCDQTIRTCKVANTRDYVTQDGKYR